MIVEQLISLIIVLTQYDSEAAYIFDYSADTIW